MHGILNEGHQVSNLQITGINANATEPDDTYNNEVESQHHNWVHHSHQLANVNGSTREVVVGICKTFLLIVCSIKGTDHTNAC